MGFQSKEGLMFGDGHVKTICYLELKIIGHCFFSSRVQKGFVKLQLAYFKLFRSFKTNEK
jgi:hypothetical protein